MIYISNGGNINGKNGERENSPDFILEAIAEGYYVEIDVKLMNDGHLWLGYEDAQYKLENNDFLFNNRKKLLIHCKNVSAVHKLKDLEDEYKTKFHFFFHRTDNASLTSNGKVIVYPGKRPLSKHSIAMLPEETDYQVNDMKICYGICSDNIEFYKKLIENESRV